MSVLAKKVVKTMMHLPGFRTSPEMTEYSENHLCREGMQAICLWAIPISSAHALIIPLFVSPRILTDEQKRVQSIVEEKRRPRAALKHPRKEID